jgi:hypothetical protein
MAEYLLVVSPASLQPDQPNPVEVYSPDTLEDAIEMFEYQLQGEELRSNVYLVQVIRKAEIDYKITTFEVPDGTT